MMPLVTSGDDMSTLAHAIIAWLPLWIALAIVAVVMFGR